MPKIYKRRTITIDDSNMLFIDGSKTMSADLNLGNNKIVNILDPTLATDGSSKKYVDDQILGLGLLTSHSDFSNLSADDHLQYIPISGVRSLTGTLDLDGNKIINISGISSSLDIGTKTYVDTEIDTNVFSLELNFKWQDNILDRDLITSPAGVISERYIIAGTGGSWSSASVNDVAEYTSSGWVFTTPVEGMSAWINDENNFFTFNGSSWVKIGNVESHSNLQSLTTDDHTQYLLANGTRPVSGNLVVNNITATSSIIDTTISGTSLISSGTLSVTGVSSLDGTSCTTLDSTSLTATNISGSRINHSTMISGVNFYANQDLEAQTLLKGLVLHSPDGSRWRTEIDDAGNLFTSKIIKSVANLPSEIIVAGSTIQPIARHNALDATISSWPHWIYGEALSISGSGADPSVLQASPLTEASDKSISYASGAKFHQAGNNSYCDVTTEDLFIEAIVKSDAGIATYPLWKRTGGQYWDLSWQGTVNKWYFQLSGTSTLINIIGSAASQNTWYYVCVGINRDENSTNGAMLYTNGIAGTANNPYTARGTATNATPVKILNTTTAINIAYFAMYRQATIWSSGATGRAEMDKLVAQRWAHIRWT